MLQAPQRVQQSAPGWLGTFLSVWLACIAAYSNCKFCFSKMRDQFLQAISFWSMQPISGPALSSKFEEGSFIWRSRARASNLRFKCFYRIFFLYEHAESIELIDLDIDLGNESIELIELTQSLASNYV